MKLKGNRSNIETQYDSEIGCFIGNYKLQCKGGGTTSTTTTAPSAAQEAILNQQLGYANKMEGLGPQQFYGGNTVAGMTGYTNEGLIAQGEASENMGALSDTASARFQDAMAYDPMNDPRTGEYLDAITNPMARQFNEETIPTMSSNAVKSGAFGGDRAQIQQERATRDFNTDVMDTRSRALQGIIGQNQQNQANMLSQLGSLQQASGVSGANLQDVGAGYEGYSQAEIDADRERFEFGENASRQSLRDASSMLGGIDFGSITTAKNKGGK
tara:strand:+ start:1670 stop:2482 length:813 start_codon:yes stop_codon:yes gene_type:complete